ncbi:MMPL family transporter, partial [Rhodococcus sp. AW25M09]|uniref:MMPL family transporter n=1 Tax=Rhodococcus sp. AW25M09 TaxID=1268303 RepID=UPI0018DEECD6
MGLVGTNDSADQSPNSLPTSAESYQVDELLAQFPDSDTAPVILVLSRADGGDLTPTDIDEAAAAQSRLLAVDRSVPDEPGPPPIVAPDGKAAIALVQVDSELSGFTLNDLVTDLRTAASDDLSPDLRAQVTGGPAFGADIANSFAGANFTLLAVTALVVAVLLIVTYRSPILWLVPLAVIGFADRFATTVGTVLAQATGLAFDGSTSGITSVLVFGAGTNYALLLISRYREELRRESDHRLALRRAVRQAGPAILASNATVVLSLLTLLLAVLPSTRSLGALAAAGLVVAAVFVLFVLPPLLALFGPKLFWPFAPKATDRDTATEGVWHSVAAGVSRRPVLTASVTIVVLLACCAALFGTQIGLSQTEQFRVTAESVEGFDTLSQHFPAGSADPMTVLAPTADIDSVIDTVESTDGVVSVDRVADSGTGLTRLSVVTDAAPASDASFTVVEALRSALAGVDGARVGGSDAKALDTTDAAARDRLIVIPAILAVVLAVLLLLLRAVVAPL